MITRSPSFITSDNRAFATLEDAQRHEIAILLSLDPETPAENSLLNLLMEKREALADVLTTTPTSKPRARAVNGGTKTRKPKPAAAPATPNLV